MPPNTALFPPSPFFPFAVGLFGLGTCYFVWGGPKGAATFGWMQNPNRLTTVKYRAPYSDHWEERPLDWAMERIAQLVKRTHDETFVQKLPDGTTVNHTLGIAELGGATLDNEENYLIKKLCGGGLGMVWIENQARI